MRHGNPLYAMTPIMVLRIEICYGLQAKLTRLTCTNQIETPRSISQLTI